MGSLVSGRPDPNVVSLGSAHACVLDRETWREADSTGCISGLHFRNCATSEAPVEGSALKPASSRRSETQRASIYVRFVGAWSDHTVPELHDFADGAACCPVGRVLYAEHIKDTPFQCQRSPEVDSKVD